jgi:DMSO/TMAO reductase YedYZ molybdopterin-dependent catalytic subunit
MSDRQHREISPCTINRRTVLEWLGKGTVLALGAEVLAACAQVEHTAGVTDARWRTEGGRDGPWSFSDAGFPFAPGTSGHEVFDGWGERTVDPQDLAKILASWTLTVDGMVQTPLELGFSELVALPRQDQVTDFHCVEGWSIYDVPWSGLHLSQLLAKAKPEAQATHVTFHTLGGSYNDSLPLSVATEPRSLLGYGIAGATLPLKHGFPLRVVVPRLLGYKNAKYVHRVELTDHPVEGYWVKAGYPYDGEVPKGRLRPGKY